MNMKLFKAARLVALALAADSVLHADADTWTDPDTGIEWYYYLNESGEAILGERTEECYGSYRRYNYSSALDPDSVDWDEYGNNLVLPAAVEDDGGASHPVVGIGEYAFDDYWGDDIADCLAGVTIPEGVRSVGNYAFRRCTALKRISLPSSLMTIGESAFLHCRLLSQVSLPAALTSIGSSAFRGCRALGDANGFVIVRGILYGYYGDAASVVIPTGVTRLDDYAFEECEMTSVTIPNTVTSLGIGVFGDCTKLVSVVIPDSVTVLDDDNDDEDYGLLDGCRSLTSVKLGKNIPRITTCMFYNCRSLTSVTVPASVKVIGRDAFRKCTNLGAIVFQGNAPVLDGYDKYLEYADDDDDDAGFLGVAGLPCVGYVSRTSTGWNVTIPGAWNGLRLEYANNVNSQLHPFQFNKTTDALSLLSASVFDGFLQDANGKIAGSIQLKVAKANARTGESKVTGTVQMGAKKTKLNGTIGPTGVFSSNGLVISLDSEGFSGSYAGYNVDGSRNVFTAKDATSKASATAAMKAYKGSYTVAWKENGLYGGVTVTVGNKGKAKIAGFLPNGTKVSANGQLMLGEGSACVTLVSTNKKAPLGFNLWLQGGSATADGLGADALAAKVGALGGGKSFTCSLLGTKVPVTIEGKKWSVKTDKATALKLTFTPKTGAFKGSFKVGKAKVTVNGVVVNGLGFGSAVIKKGDKAGVTIE